MNDPSPSIHTSTEPPQGLSSPPIVPISPCRAVPTCPFLCLFYHEPPRRPPATVFLYIKDHPGPRWSRLADGH